MGAKVLVAYATKYGATAEIAQKIGEVLDQAGVAADVMPVDQVKDLDSYERSCWAAACTSAAGERRRPAS